MVWCDSLALTITISIFPRLFYPGMAIAVFTSIVIVLYSTAKPHACELVPVSIIHTQNSVIYIAEYLILYLNL